MAYIISYGPDLGQYIQFNFLFIYLFIHLFIYLFMY